MYLGFPNFKFGSKTLGAIKMSESYDRETDQGGGLGGRDQHFWLIFKAT